MFKGNSVRIAIVAIAAGVIMVPEAPVEAKPKSTAASASAKKPKRSYYSSKSTKRPRARTAAEVINQRANQRHVAFRQTRAQRAQAAAAKARAARTARAVTQAPRPGLARRFVNWVGSFFSRPSASARRGTVASARLERLVRGPDGKLQQRQS